MGRSFAVRKAGVVVSPTELAETCERELVEFLEAERHAIDAQTAAQATFKAEPTDKNRKAGEKADTDAKYAALAREGAAERLAQARAALSAAEREAELHAIAEGLEATSLATFRATIADVARKRLELTAQTAELEKTLTANASQFEHARKQLLARMFKLGLPLAPMIAYDALKPGQSHEHKIEPLDACFSGAVLVNVKAKLFALRDAERRKAYVLEGGTLLQREEVEREIAGIRAELAALGATAFADQVTTPASAEVARTEMANDVGRQIASHAMAGDGRARRFAPPAN
jgi:hypothetical protein